MANHNIPHVRILLEDGHLHITATIFSVSEVIVLIDILDNYRRILDLLNHAYDKETAS
jgi:hypothetical protein